MSDTEENVYDDFEDDDQSNIFDGFEYNVQDIAEGNHFDHLKSEDFCSRHSIEILRITKVEEILKCETSYESELRATLGTKLGAEMLRRQESDIQTSFQAVNYLRAELAELVPNKDIPLLKKGILAKYIIANRKELQSRQVYADIVRNAALGDASAGISNEEWVHRVESDISMVRETKRVKVENKNIPDVVLRKKHDYDHNRARAILKADLAALSSAWPNDSYAHLVA